MDIVDAIDAAVGCHTCGGPMGDSVSDTFCRERCQKAWAAKRVGVDPEYPLRPVALTPCVPEIAPSEPRTSGPNLLDVMAVRDPDASVVAAGRAYLASFLTARRSR